MTTIARISALMIAGLLLVACQPSGPLRSFTVGEELAYYDFSRPDAFEQGAYATASLLIRDGLYRIDVREGDNELWWGQWGDVYDDVVIDVDAMQVSERPENAYGVMCRVRGRVGQPVDASDLVIDEDAELDAAEVLATQANEQADESAADEEAALEATADAEVTVEADSTTDSTAEATEEDEAEATGEADEESTEEPDEEPATEATEEAEIDPSAEVVESTPETSGTNLGGALDSSNGDGYLFLIQGGGSYGIFRARGRDLTPLVNWQTSDAINVGPAENRLRAVCVGDYLAFYVNDRLVAEATDPTYTSGQVGLAASAASRLGARIEFDNLTVSAATPG